MSSPSYNQQVNAGFTPHSNIKPQLGIPNIKTSLADIVRTKDNDSRNQQLESYWDEAAVAGGVNRSALQSNPSLNPFRPKPLLADVVRKNLPTFTNSTNQVINMNKPIQAPTLPISSVGGSPINVSLDDVLGQNSPLKQIGNIPIPPQMVESGNMGNGLDEDFLNWLFTIMQGSPSLEVGGVNGIGVGIPRFGSSNFSY